MNDKLEALKPFFFNTPLVEISFTYKNSPIKKIYAKYEAHNYSGSIKDRLAYEIFNLAYNDGSLKEGQEIVEVTSGNTGIALASLARSLKHPITIFMPDWLSTERYSIMELLSVNVIKVSSDEGGFLGSIEKAKKYAKDKGIYYPDQFSNLSNIKIHEETTAVEIINQLNKISKKADIFVAGVGTGGTVMGVDKGFKSYGIEANCHPLEPANSPTLSSGGKKIGSHRIQGISDEFIPEILKIDRLSKIVSVDDGDSIKMARKINKSGLSVGISSGANFLGALKILLENDSDACAVTVFSDSSFKYLSTALCCCDEEDKESFLSKDVKIHSLKSIV